MKNQKHGTIRIFFIDYQVCFSRILNNSTLILGKNPAKNSIFVAYILYSKFNTVILNEIIRI